MPGHSFLFSDCQWARYHVEFQVWVPCSLFSRTFDLVNKKYLCNINKKIGNQQEVWRRETKVNGRAEERDYNASKGTFSPSYILSYFKNQKHTDDLLWIKDYFKHRFWGIEWRIHNRYSIYACWIYERMNKYIISALMNHTSMEESHNK